MAAAPRAEPPQSCDTFVYVAGLGGPDATIFGKNSDRPSDEAQEVVFVPGARFERGSKVSCTYIEIPQAEETLSVVLSKPCWMWGCEMGANDHGVVGGNEAVWTALAGELGSTQRLLGMDVLRLSLERGATARDAARICAELTETHGQGGGCAEGDPSWTYENGYIFADCHEAFVVETCGPHGWAMERVPPGGFRNISNDVSIRSDVFAVKEGLQEDLAGRGWTGSGTTFDWRLALNRGRAPEMGDREEAGKDFLAAMARDVREGSLKSEDRRAWAERFMAVLRDEESGICFSSAHGFTSTGSQVSVLPLPSGETATQPVDQPLQQHMFACASDPSTTTYKRFGFPCAAAAEVAGSGHGSLALWQERRRLALAGRRSKLPASAAEQLRRWEAVALDAMAAGEAAAPATLAEACAQELALLRELEGESGKRKSEGSQ